MIDLSMKTKNLASFALETLSEQNRHQPHFKITTANQLTESMTNLYNFLLKFGVVLMF